MAYTHLCIDPWIGDAETQRTGRARSQFDPVPTTGACLQRRPDHKRVFILPSPVRRLPAPVPLVILGLVRLGLMVCLLFVPVVLRAASLQVHGPRGAELRLDGELMGMLPLPAPLQVEPGEYQLECSMKGYTTHREHLSIPNQDSEISVDIELLGLRRSSAVGYSLVLAGLGQLYEGRTKTGWTLMALEIGAAVTAAVAENAFRGSRNDFEIADREYRTAVSAQEVATLRAQRQAAFDDMSNDEDLRNAALGALAGVVLYSVVDAWLGFDRLYVDTALSDFTSAGGRPAPGLRLGWRLAF